MDWEFLGSRLAQRRARTSCPFPSRTCTLVNPLGLLNLVPRVQRVLTFSQEGAVLQAQREGAALQAQMEYRPSCRIFFKCPIRHPETFQQCGQRVTSWHFRLTLLTGSPSKRYPRVPSVLHSLTAIHSLRLACLPVSLAVCTVRTTYLRATGAKTEKNATITERAGPQHENRLRCANTNRSSRAVGAQVRILIHEFVLRGV